jgi:hypothetical protein
VLTDRAILDAIVCAKRSIADWRDGVGDKDGSRTGGSTATGASGTIGARAGCKTY